MRALLRNNFVPPALIGLMTWGIFVFAPSYKDEAYVFEKKDVAELRAKAEQGDVESQYWLGFVYGDGEGVQKDLTESLKWTKLAAEQGHAKSQYKLGLMHEKGMGRPAVGRSGNSGGGGLGVTAAPTRQRLGLSYAEAVKWYSMAANQGFVDAQYNLGLMYASGGGIPEDYMGAYLWWTVANAYGNEQAGTKLNILKSLMSERDIVEAQRLARDWWEKRR